MKYIRLHFGLKSFLIFLAILCAGLSYIAVLERRAAAIAEMEAQSAMFGWIQSCRRESRQEMNSQFRWLYSFIPDRYRDVVDNVHVVSLEDLGDYGEPFVFDFRNLRFVPEVRELHVSGGGIDERRLLEIPPMPNLDKVWLDSAGTDVVVCHIVEMAPKITIFVLDDNAVTNKSIDCICRLENVSELYFRDTQVTAAGLLKLRCLTKLKELHANSDIISEQEIQELKVHLPINLDD